MMIILSPVVAATEFSEIMYDPQGSDNNLEYIELLTTENLDGWIVGDLSSNDTLELVQQGQGKVALIVEEGFNTTGLHCTIYSAGASIGNNLNNAGDEVFLYNNNSLVASTSYDDSMAKDNNLSLHWKNEWIEGVPTPCIIDSEEGINSTEDSNDQNTTINNTPPQINVTLNKTTTNHSINCTINETILSSNNTEIDNSINTNHTIPSNQTSVNTTNQTTQYNETIANSTVNQTAEPTNNETDPNTELNQTEEPNLNETDSELPTNETNDQTNTTKGKELTCTVKIQLQQEKPFYENKESIKFKNIVNGTNDFAVTYTITTLTGKVIRNTTTTNENQKTFTPNINKEIEVFILKSELRSECGTDIDEKILIVRGESNTNSKTNISILKTNKEEYQAGEIVMIDVKIARMNTQKSAIKLWVEQDDKKVSEVTSLSIKDDGEFEFSLPIALKERVEDGIAVVKVEGFGLEKEKEIELEEREKEEEKVYTITEEPITITNFRTNHKKPSKEINLYAKLSGNGVYIVRLRTLEGYEDQVIGLDGTKQFKKAIEIKEGHNVFLLEMLQDNETLASASLLLEMTEEGIEEVEYFSEEVVEAQPKDEVKIESPIIQAIQAPTQQAYKEESTSRFLPYVLGIIVVVIAGIVFMQMRSKKEEKVKTPESTV